MGEYLESVNINKYDSFIDAYDLRSKWRIWL